MVEESSRPELFFLYGVVISAIILVIFFTKISQLSDFEDIILEFTADEIALTAEVSAARSGYTFIPVSIARLENPSASISDGMLVLHYAPEGDPGSCDEAGSEVRPGFSESRSLVVRSHESKVCGERFAIVSQNRAVRIEPMADCSRDASNITIGDPGTAQMVTVIVSSEDTGCDVFDRIVALRGSSNGVQRVVVPRESIERYGVEVVVFAR